MTEWYDTGYVLMTKLHNEKYSITYIFTEKHGKVAGLITKYTIISNFSRVEIAYISKYSYGLGFFKILKYKELWVHFLYDATKMQILNNICQVLNFALPLNSDERNVYRLTDLMYTNLADNHDISTMYQVFHAKLLELLGYGHDPRQNDIVKRINDILLIDSLVA